MSKANFKTSGKYWAIFDDMTWPHPGPAMNDLEWRLRYGAPSREDLLVAASVISAYQQMVNDPREKRQRVVTVLRAAAKEAP